MYWENIEGMFTFQLLYSNMVNKFGNNSTFVEIGTWKGKSAVYMAEKIKDSGKRILFYTIDIFTGEDGYDYDQDVKDGNLFEKFTQNIEPVKTYIQPLVGDSKILYENFKNESIDFLFVDGDHRYKSVKEDLKLWFPKIKPGGIISGHDYNEPSCGVRQAVDEFFTFGAQCYEGGCWIFYK
jgi:predicted O-methyltransferase YrrM